MDNISNNTIITIGRQLGSGGRDIGRKLADKLGIKFYDKELIAEAAKESGLSENLFEGMDEKPTNSFLYSIVMGVQTGKGLYYQYSDALNGDNIFKIQSDVIKKLANENSCVIVGRCADYILRNYPNLIKVFIHADKDFRKDRLTNVLKMTPKEADTSMVKTDKNRANYYNFYTNNVWGSVENYHISLNSGAIGIDNSVEVLKQFVKIKNNL